MYRQGSRFVSNAFCYLSSPHASHDLEIWLSCTCSFPGSSDFFYFLMTTCLVLESRYSRIIKLVSIRCFGINPCSALQYMLCPSKMTSSHPSSNPFSYIQTPLYRKFGAIMIDPFVNPQRGYSPAQKVESRQVQKPPESFSTQGQFHVSPFKKRKGKQSATGAFPVSLQALLQSTGPNIEINPGVNRFTPNASSTTHPPDNAPHP